MKNLLIVFCLSLCNYLAIAQMPAGGPPAGMKAPEAKIFGKIVDENGKAAEYASVVLLKTTVDPATKQSKDVMVKGQTSEANGDFSFTEVPLSMGAKMKLKISLVGYKTLEVPITFAMPKMDGAMPKPGQQPDPAVLAKLMEAFNKDMGNLKLEPDAQNLNGVTVTAQKALLEMDIDKKIFNVEKNIVSAGGTAVDVMRNIPSLQVDIDGNVKLRNAAPTIFIDGRPTTLSLDQIPADAIEKVEVITNPSAKYDASGSMAGILNVVLKKNKKTGINGMINAGADSNGGTNLMASLSIKEKKWGLTYTGMNMNMRNITNGNSERSSDIGGIYSNIMQDITSKTKGMMLINRFTVDYNISNRSTVSIGTVLGGGKFKPTEDILITNTIGATTTMSNRLSESSREFKPQALTLGFRQAFPTAGEELTVDINYFGGDNNSNALYTTNYMNATGTITGTQLQKNIGTGQNKFITFQTDYVKPFKSGLNLETGLRAQINELQNVNDNTLKPVGSDVFKSIASASTNYQSQNNIYAAYLSVSGKASKLFSYKLGLRAESSAYDGKLLNTGQKFTNNYPVSLFPSVFLSKELSKTDQLQVSLTRRISRPNFFQLIPFVDYSDSLNITRGNANLVPEFTTSAELSYSKTLGTGTFLSSLYFKKSTDLITRYLNQELNPISGKLDLINTYINANSSINYGAEFTYTNKIQKWWDFTANLNLYNTKINTANIDNATNTPALWTAFGKINNNFSLPNKWVIQLSGDYQGKTNMPVTQNQGFGPPMSQAQSSSQGYIEPFYGIDLAVKKTFLKNDLASATLSVNDIFRSRGNTQISYGEGFSQSYYRLANPQIVKLNISFRFGKMDTSIFKKNNNNSSQEGLQMQ